MLLLLIAMALRMRSKLPAFNVTQRSKAGVVRRSVPRGRKDDDNAAACTGDRFSGVEEEDASDPKSDFSFTSTFEPSGAITGETSGQPDVSLHAIKQKASTAAWGQVRSALLKAVVESNAMPEGQRCISFPDSATYRCVQCTPGLIIVISAFWWHIPGSIF